MEATSPADKRPQKLNDIQITLLRMFNRNMTDQEATEVREIILDYYDEKLNAELTTVIAQKKYTQQDFNEMLNHQNRTEFNQEIKQIRDAGSH